MSLTNPSPFYSTLRSTHAFFGRLRDMTDLSSSPPKMKRSISNGSATATATQTQTQTETQIPSSSASIPIDPRLLDVATNPIPSASSGPPLKRQRTLIASHVMATPISQPTARLRDARKGRRRRARQVFQPEAGSLCSILHEYAGESLFVRPIMWTNAHLSAFGVKFVQLPPCQRPRPVSSEGWRQPAPSSKLFRLTGNINMVLSMNKAAIGREPPLNSANRLCGLNELFAIMYPDRKIICAPGKNHLLPLFVWGAPYPQVCNIEILWHDEAKKSTMGFLDKASLQFVRKSRMFSVSSRNGVENTAVKELVRKRINLILPADRDADPYLAGAFVAMAQSRFYPASLETKRMALGVAKRTFRDLRMPKFTDTQLRILTTDDGQTFSVYTATVTAKLLTALHCPIDKELRSGPDDFGMTIEHTKVDIFPLLGLKERLGKALGQDLVGDVNFEGMETYEEPKLGDSDADDSDGDTVAFSTIRRVGSLPSTASISTRRVLSDLTNDSPEEEHPAKKRCIGVNDSFLGVEEAASVDTTVASASAARLSHDTLSRDM